MTRKYSLESLRTFLETVLSKEGNAAQVRRPSAYDFTARSLIEIEIAERLEALNETLAVQGEYLERIAITLERAQRSLPREEP